MGLVADRAIGQGERPAGVAVVGPVANTQAGGGAGQQGSGQTAHRHGRFLIEGRLHLVEQHHGRARGEGPQQRHPGLLAARELGRTVVESHPVKLREGQQLLEGLIARRLRASIHLQRPGKPQIVPHGARHQSRSLGHQAHAPAPFGGMKAVEGHAVQGKGSARARQHEGAGRQQRGLPRPRRAGEVVHPAALQGKAHVRERGEGLSVALVLHADMLGFKHGHGPMLPDPAHRGGRAPPTVTSPATGGTARTPQLSRPPGPFRPSSPGPAPLLTRGPLAGSPFA